ncbi:MAG: sugar ABC transporter ATP-binding protein [Clostridiaceae bacterium]|nr:sugar ABC transporter ATP-binding protein [Clostridiaceae bacterium]
MITQNNELIHSMNSENLINSDQSINTNDIVLSVNNIARSYGSTKALTSTSFNVRRGEVHALMGENGSGKSTLVKILNGIISPDAGSLTIDGIEYNRLPTPKFAHELGIGTSFQEILIVPEQSVLNNIWLGYGPSLMRTIPDEQRRQKASEVLGELLGEEPNLDIPIERLEISRQQLCVIARAMLMDPKICILDEPTAALDIADRNRLFDIIRRMTENGTSFIYITHRMDEIMEICDRATVLRAGESVGTLDKEQISPAVLIKMMSGDVGIMKERKKTTKTVKVRMRISDLQIAKNRPTFSLEAYEGEIIGVAGLEGHGQDEFIGMLAGINNPLQGTITVMTDQGEKSYRTLKEASKVGIVYVPRNRKTAGIFEPLSIIDNFTLPALPRYTKGGFLQTKRMKQDFENYRKKLNFRMSNQSAPISTLSGGNQQKILVSRWLNMNPRTIIFNDPTRGVDPRTKIDIYEIAYDLAANGATVIFLSTDVEELIHLVDRAWIFRDGAFEAEIQREKLTSNAVIAAFFGHKDQMQEEQ